MNVNTTTKNKNDNENDNENDNSIDVTFLPPINKHHQDGNDCESEVNNYSSLRILRTTTTHTPTLSPLSTQTSTTPTTFATIPTTPMVLETEKELSRDAGNITNRNKKRKQCPQEDSHISSHRASILKGNVNNNNNNTKVPEASHTQTQYGINTDVYISGDNKVPQADNFTPLSLSIKSSSSLPPLLSSPSSSMFSPAVSTSYKKEQDALQLNIFTPSPLTPLHIYNGKSAGQGHGHGQAETETTEQHAYHSLYPMADTGMNTKTKTNSAEDDVPETVFSAAESNRTVATGSRERNTKKQELKFRMFAHILIKYLEMKGKNLHQQAITIMNDCGARNKRQEPGYESVTEPMKRRLKELVGKHCWEKANTYLIRFIKQKKMQLHAATTSGRGRSEGLNIFSAATEPNNVATNTNTNTNTNTITFNDDGNGKGNSDDNTGPPTSVQLSAELCKIVDFHYTRDEGAFALVQLASWTSQHPNDQNFWKYFYRYGGLAKVFDFLSATMNDSNCKGKLRMACINNAAFIIKMVCCGVCSRKPRGINKDIATKIVTSAIDCNGIDILIHASKEYNGGNDHFELSAANSIWGAFAFITCSNIKMSEDQALFGVNKGLDIFIAGLDMIYFLRTVDDTIASEPLRRVFMALVNLVENDTVTKNFFKGINTLAKCLDIFRKNNSTWECRTAALMTVVLVFFNTCLLRGFYDQDSDYEKLLHFIIFGAKKFPENIRIQKLAVNLLAGSWNKYNGKIVVERFGAMEVLEALLVSDDVDECFKNKIRALIRWIRRP